MKLRHSLIFPSALLLLFSCKTVPEKTSYESPVVTVPQEQQGITNTTPSDTLTLLFGGDIMAHVQNFKINDYSVIWHDAAPVIQSADFSFANIESPVDDDIPYTSYPAFNMHHEYPEAAIQAGFNVFSLTNNHANDQSLAGIMHTLKWAEETENKYAGNSRPVYFTGLHNKKNEPVDYVIIKKDRWTIVFCAVTEILNKNDCKEYMNYVPANERARREFEKHLQEIKKQNQCDLLILSIHAAVPEYVREVSDSQRTYYYELINSGVDIVWANHPHVVQERELIGIEGTGGFSKLIMYANGNTISGQRRDPKLDAPYGQREYTGDGLLYKVTYTKKGDSSHAVLEETESYYITTYINTASQFVIKFLNDDFIDYLKDAGRINWSSYISERKKIMEKTKETKTWL